MIWCRHKWKYYGKQLYIEVDIVGLDGILRTGHRKPFTNRFCIKCKEEQEIQFRNDKVRWQYVKKEPLEK